MAVISSLSVATLRMEKCRGEQKNITRSDHSATLFFLFCQYDFVVDLLQGFMINVLESGSNSGGGGGGGGLAGI